MYGVAVALQSSEEAEGEEADGEAHQRHGDAHPCDDGEEELVHAAVPLPSERRDTVPLSAAAVIFYFLRLKVR